MKYTDNKNFYTRTLLLPVLAVAAFVFYCANHGNVSADDMVKSIDNTMVNSFYVEEGPTDVLALIPATKPEQTFDVASK